MYLCPAYGVGFALVVLGCRVMQVCANLWPYGYGDLVIAEGGSCSGGQTLIEISEQVQQWLVQWNSDDPVSDSYVACVEQDGEGQIFATMDYPPCLYEGIEYYKSFVEQLPSSTPAPSSDTLGIEALFGLAIVLCFAIGYLSGINLVGSSK